MLGQWLYRAVTALEARWYGFRHQHQCVGDTQLHWYDSAPDDADKPVLLLLHGFSADKTLWLRFARHFTQHYRVLIPDLPGHGESSYLPRAGYALDDYIRILLHWLDSLGVSRMVIAGNSMGGQIAAQLAASHTARVEQVILFDPSGLYGLTPSEHDQHLARGENVFLMTSREDFRRFYPMTMARPPVMPGIVLSALADDYCRRRKQLAHLFDDFIASPAPDARFASSGVPVLIIWGKQDRLTHVSAASAWQVLRPDLKLIVWDDLGHMPMLEAPRRSAHAVSAFLSDC
ncbi:alpha/beta fold hydrolase [Alteromonas sp. CYL-A6]|uniref:alpha/beta fold hydrolase n=1 Tax=Alteromonas nitratireducens TaxID=3390813 RepID=UPI0034B37B95